MRERDGEVGPERRPERRPRIGVDAGRDVDRDPFRRGCAHRPEHLDDVPRDRPVQPGPEDRVHDDVGARDGVPEVTAPVRVERGTHGATDADERIVVGPRVAVQSHRIDDREQRHVRPPPAQVPRDDEPVPSVVPAAAHDDDTRAARVPVERFALDYVRGAAACVLHQNEPGHLARLDEVLVEVAHLRARQRRSHGVLRSSTTTAAAIPASCEIVTCHLSAPELLHHRERVPLELEARPAVLGAPHLHLVPPDAGRAVERLRERLLHGEAPRESRRHVAPGKVHPLPLTADAREEPVPVALERAPHPLD